MNDLRPLEFAAPDLPLRDEVRRLGALVGEMLAIVWLLIPGERKKPARMD